MAEHDPSGGPPTFSRDISPLFTQYDVIQMSYAFDLRSYDDVKNYADAIYRVVQPNPEVPGQSLLPGIPVMPLYEAPWTDDMVATFKAWMDAGYPPGRLPPPPPPISEELPAFLALSAALTGIEQVTEMEELGQIYLDRLLATSEHADAMPRLLAVWEEIGLLPADEQQAAVGEVMAEAPLAALAQDVIVVWYNTAIGDNLGTPQNNQYVDALVWPVAQCHPMGWATEITPFYWQFYPQGSQYTGLRPPTPPQSQQGNGDGEEDSDG